MTTRAMSQHRFGSALAATALLFACVGTAAAQNPKMPSCAELEKASAEALVGFLAQDRKGVSDACLEFALRRLWTVQLTPSQANRAVDELFPLLDFPSTMANPLFGNINTQFYVFPARTALGHATLELGNAEHVQRVVARLIAVVADTTVSDTVARNAVWVLDGIVGYPNPVGGRLKTVETLIEAARQNANAFSATRLRAQARRLAQECVGSELRSQCEAAAN